MSSDVDICNQALSAIGTRSFIQALTENSAEAAQCKIIYDASRDELLRAYRWGFALKQLALTVLQAAAGTPENATGTSLTAPPLPWRYAYAYPGDCLMARRILPLQSPVGLTPPLTSAPAVAIALPFSNGPNAPGVRFATAQITDAQRNPVKALLTDQQQAILDYTVATPNPGMFDAEFVTALVGRLAAKLVIPLSGDKLLAKMAVDAGTRVEGFAAARDANEGFTTVNREASWIAARGAGVEIDARWLCTDGIW